MKTTFFGKTVSTLASASLLLTMLAPLMIPSTARADPPSVYTIAGSYSLTGAILTLSGTATSTNMTGTDIGQHMAVDWDMDRNASTTSWIEYSSAGGLTTFSPIFSGTGGNQGFIATWNGSHDYSSLGGGTYTVRVMVYHGGTTGHDGSASLDTLVFTIVIPPTTADLIVKKVLINAGGGTAATSSFSFQVNGGTATPFETDGENVFTLAAGPYSVVEVPAAHYSIGYDNCSGTIVAGAATTTCTITNTFFNNPPVANNSSITTDEDTATSSSVTATDADSDSLIYSFGSPLHGILSFLNSLTGAFTYTPDANYNGSDSFTFSVFDGVATSAGGTIAITVNPINDAPVANNDSASTDEDTPVTTGNVLANDTDADGDTLSVSAADSISTNGGTVVDNGDGTFDYTPPLNFNGSDAFTYTISDGNGGTDTATVNVTIDDDNDEPVAVVDSYSTAEDTTLNVAAAGVLTNDTDDDSDPLTAELDTDVSSGTLAINADGSFSYTPDADFNGTDSFTYHAVDTSDAVSSTVTVTITVTPVNDVPVAVGQSISTAQNVPFSGTLGASDIDGDTLTYATTTNPANGILSFFNHATGVFTYTPNSNYAGLDTFDFKANDGSLDSNLATVGITVTASPENTVQLCSDSIDNDNDGLIDLADSDCAAFIPTLTVIKNVINNNSGTATSSDFIMAVAGTNVSSTTFMGSASGVVLTLMPGDYSVTESGPSGYAATMSEDCSGAIAAGDTKTCTITNDDIVPTPTPTPTQTPSPSPAPASPGAISPIFIGGGGSGQVLGASTTTGRVLGVSCGLYMGQHLKKGSAKNKPDQVTKLQQFLNKNGFGKFTPTGTFGPLTFAAAKAFQNKYSNEILKPWSLSGPTGLVYLTTIRQLNLLECPELMLPLPALVPWNQNPNAQ